MTSTSTEVEVTEGSCGVTSIPPPPPAASKRKRSTPPPSELEEGLTTVLGSLKTQMQPEKKDPVDYLDLLLPNL